MLMDAGCKRRVIIHCCTVEAVAVEMASKIEFADGALVEAVEVPGSPFFVGVQYHPEFKSRPDRPHPVFAAFVAAAGQRAQTP